MQEGPGKHYRLTACMLTSGAIAMRHGPQIILWLAGGMLVALIIVILKLCLTMIQKGRGRHLSLMFFKLFHQLLDS